MPTEYIHFTEEQKQQARQTDLVALLQSQGEHLKRSGKEYVWRDGSEKVTVRGNLWFHQYERIGGDAVDFVRRFYNMDFPQAVNFLLGNNGGTLQRAEPIRREPPKPLAQRCIRRSSTKQPMRKYRKQSMGATHKRIWTKHRTYSS